MANVFEWLGQFAQNVHEAKRDVALRRQQERLSGSATAMAPALARQLRASGMGPENPAAATAVGLMMDPATRPLGVEQALQLFGQLQESGKPLTPYQQEQVGNWQRQAAQAAEQMEISRQQLELRRKELEQSARFRAQSLAQAADRIDLQFRPTPGQGQTLAGAEYGLSLVDLLIGMGKPEYFGYVSDNVGEAALEYKRRFGTDVDFTEFWNLVDSAYIEINSERMKGVLSDQDIRMLNSTKPKRSDAPEVAFAALGNMRLLMELARNRSLQAIDISGRKAPGSPPAQAPKAQIPPPPPGFQRVQ